MEIDEWRQSEDKEKKKHDQDVDQNRMDAKKGLKEKKIYEVEKKEKEKK